MGCVQYFEDGITPPLLTWFFVVPLIFFIFKRSSPGVLPGLGPKKWVGFKKTRTVTEVHAKKWVGFNISRTVSQLCFCIYKIGAHVWIQTWSENE